MLKKKVVKKNSGTNIDTVRRVFAGLDEGEKWWKPKIGKNIIRILPSNLDDGNVAYHAIQHYGFKVDGQNRAFPCLSAFGKPCPVCRLIALNDTDMDPDIKEACNNLSPRHSYIMNIIDRTKPDSGPRLYSAPKSVMKEIYYLFNDDDYGDITSEADGRDLKIDRSGEGLQTRYSVRISPKTSAIDYENWQAECFDMQKEAYREIPSEKKYISYLLASFGDVLNLDDLDSDGEDVDEEIEEEEVIVPKKKKKIKKESNKATDADDLPF